MTDCLVNVFNSTATDQGYYGGTGTRFFDWSNSNSFNNYLITKAGVQNGQINTIKSALQISSGRSAPGIGTSMSSPSSLQNTLTSRSSALKTLSAILSGRSAS